MAKRKGRMVAVVLFLVDAQMYCPIFFFCKLASEGKSSIRMMMGYRVWVRV